MINILKEVIHYQVSKKVKEFYKDFSYYSRDIKNKLIGDI